MYEESLSLCGGLRQYGSLRETRSIPGHNTYGLFGVSGPVLKRFLIKLNGFKVEKLLKISPPENF